MLLTSSLLLGATTHSLTTNFSALYSRTMVVVDFENTFENLNFKVGREKLHG